MIITTIQEANLQDCGCCAYPICEAPQKECQSIFGSGFQSGFIDTVYDPTYKTLRQTYDNGAGRWTQYDRNTTIIASLGDVSVSDPITTTTTTGGPANFDNPLISEYSNPVSWADARAEILALFSAELPGAWDDSDFEKGDLCYSEFLWNDPGPGVGNDLFATYARYRLAPPASFLTTESIRTTYEVEWDEVFFPKEWDEWDQGGRIGAEPSPTPSLVTERSWVWDGIKTDPERWSEWYSITLPTNPGQTRIVNMMVTCWKSIRTGSKPTAFGEVYEFPPP